MAFQVFFFNKNALQLATVLMLAMNLRYHDHLRGAYFLLLNFPLQRCAREFRALLAEVITGEAASHVAEDGKTVVNSWTVAKELLKPDPRYSKMPRKDRESLWRRHVDDITRKRKRSDTKDEKANPVEKVKPPMDSRNSPLPGRNHGRR